MFPPKLLYGLGKYWLIFYIFILQFFFINPTIKWIIITFPYDIQLISFSFNYFFYSKFFSISLLQFLFIKSSNKFFTIKVIYLLQFFFMESSNNFLITKSSSDQFGVCPLAKMFVYMEILTWSPTLNLGSFSLESALHSA